MTREHKGKQCKEYQECKDPIEFNPYISELESGINLIEASAGTGKTFSIAMLVLRFIVEKGFTIDQLLVVTFTNAAAQELRDRIRSRLVEVKKALSNQNLDSVRPISNSTTTETALNDWMANLANSQEAKLKLVDALANIDNAPIFTIHGFCQRILAQYALESGQVFGAELLQNITHLRQQIAEDYWRLETYSRPAQQVGLLRNTATSPYELLKHIEGVREGSLLLPERVELEDCLADIEDIIKGIKPALPVLLASIETALEAKSEMFKPAFVIHFPLIQTQLEPWLNHDVSLPVDAVLALSTQQLFIAALNGNKFRKTKLLTGEARKQAFLEAYSIDPQPIDQLENQLSLLGIAFKQGLYNTMQIELESRLTKSNQLSFDGMIKRLSHALRDQEVNDGQAVGGQPSEHLRQVLQDKFPVAMIDEFQDTDDAQWSIFSSLAGNTDRSADKSADNYLYLIGDPKQAIYKFRGADIYSYLMAQRKADRKYNLATNWRSHTHLVNAVNTLFAVENPFLIDQIAYYPVQAMIQDSALEQSHHSLEKLMLWELDKNPQHKDGYWLSGKGKPKEQIRTHVVNEILYLLDQDHQTQLDNRPLCPSDMAILVRSNTEAAAYQQALIGYGLPSVLNSKTSVFASTQAQEVYHVLQAVLRAGNPQLLRYALCQPWFGYSGNDLYELQGQQPLMDNWVISFQRHHEQWEKKGLLAMMQGLIEEQGVVQHLVKYTDVERRLTNINHILELIQEAAITNRLSMVKTLEWLEDAIQQRVVAEGQELRLESDENAINIVTIHSAKGLEFPVVFCPDLWAKTRGNQSGVVVCHKEGQQISDLGSDQIDECRELSQLEDQAEELRLLYVAITRAKYRCYVGWVDQRTTKDENNSALAYLLKQQAGESWQERMATLLEIEPEGFDYQRLDVDKEIQNHYIQCDPQVIQKNRQLTRTIKTDWMMSSYSAMAYHSIHEDVRDSEIPELPLDKAEEQGSMRDKTISDTINDETIGQNEETLPKGAHTGNLVHELLEYTPFATLSENINDAEYTQSRTEMIQRFAVEIEDTSVLDKLLQDTVNTPLSEGDTNFVLAKLNEAQCLKEMPFYFAVNQLDTAKINAILSASEAYLPLSPQQIHGQLTGFIDLICEYQGQYYVMDYKTNSLADYSAQSMTDSMREHNYGLQYWLYSLVLHRYLIQTLEGYSFDQHFGGVRYLFVRGMNPEDAMSGVFQDQPDLTTLEALSQVFDSG